MNFKNQLCNKCCGCWINKNYVFKETNSFSLDMEGCKDLWIKVEAKNNKTLVIGVIYRRPNCKITEYQTAIEKTIEQLNLTSSTYYIIGDINIDLSNVKNDANITQYNTLHSHECTQVIEKSPGISITSFSLLDYIYTNNASQLITSHAIIYDHLPVLAMAKKFQLPKL